MDPNAQVGSTAGMPSDGASDEAYMPTPEVKPELIEEPDAGFGDMMDEATSDEEEDVIVNAGTDIDSLFEEDGVDEAVEEREQEADPLADMSDDDLDAMFAGEAEPEEIASILDGDSNDDSTDDVIDIDDIPDPEPLPESLTSDLHDDALPDVDDDEVPRRRRVPPRKKKGKGGLIVSIVMVIFLLGSGGAFVFLQNMIVQMVPSLTPVYETLAPVYEALAPVYEMIGLTEPLGEGLEIGDVSSERTSEGGVDFLVVSGTVTNTSESEKSVPLVKALLVDGDGVEVQSVVQEPGAAVLAGGDVLQFSVTIEEPSILARRLEVTFAPRPDEAAQ